MSKPEIAAQPDRIDAAWMTLALRAAGVLPEGQVATVQTKPVGNGLIGDSFRFSLTYDGAASDAPASVIGKFPALDAASRASGAGFGLYLREVSFYRELAGTVGIITPRPYFAEIDPATSDFTLILEDLAPARPGDQLAGCSPADAETALLEAAALHAPWWGNPALEDFAWLRAADEAAPQLAAALPAVVPLFKDRYGDLLDADVQALVDRLPAAVAAMQTQRSGPLTVQHGDFRLDNVLFDIQGGRRRMGTLDWQTIAIGNGVVDATYFLSAGLSPEDRRRHERDLIARYHAELLRLGVRDYGFDQCWHDYRRYAVHGVMMGVFSAMAVERTDRGDALFLKMTCGACAQALDHGAFELWGA